MLASLQSLYLKFHPSISTPPFLPQLALHEYDGQDNLSSWESPWQAPSHPEPDILIQLHNQHCRNDCYADEAESHPQLSNNIMRLNLGPISYLFITAVLHSTSPSPSMAPASSTNANMAGLQVDPFSMEDMLNGIFQPI